MAISAVSAHVPSLSIVEGGAPSGARSRLGTLLLDGSASIAVGAAVAAGVGVEAISSFTAREAAGRWWLIALLAVGLGLVVFGFCSRQPRPYVRVGLVVTASDRRRGAAQAQQLNAAAESFSRQRSQLTLRVGGELAGDDTDPELVDRMAEEIRGAVTLARRLVPDASGLDLIPTMPLHTAFRLGAKLGHTHATDIAVHAVSRCSGSQGYFPAVLLRAGEPAAAPLVLNTLRPLSAGDPARAALALDLQNRGASFRAQVLAACEQYGIGQLLLLRNPASTLRENMDTFTAVVDQAAQAWRDAPLAPTARTGQHAVFLSGPVPIALALGARLATTDAARWTAYTWDRSRSGYEPMPIG
ncbi:MAG: SAVED domain-containing protein [Sciscionella sp.]